MNVYLTSSETDVIRHCDFVKALGVVVPLLVEKHHGYLTNGANAALSRHDVWVQSVTLANPIFKDKIIAEAGVHRCLKQLPIIRASELLVQGQTLKFPVEVDKEFAEEKLQELRERLKVTLETRSKAIKFTI